MDKENKNKKIKITHSRKLHNQPVERIEIDLSRFTDDLNPECLPILPTRNLVLFPGTTISVELGRESAIELAKAANEMAIPIGVVCQLKPDEESPTITTGLYKYGVCAHVLNLFERPDGTYSALVRSSNRFRILGRSGETFPTWARLCARVRILEDVNDNPFGFEVACQQIREMAEKTISENDNPGMLNHIQHMEDNVELINFLCTNLPFETEAKIKILSKNKLYDRAIEVLGEMHLFNDRVEITRQIMKRAQRNMEEGQKNAFLQQQMEAIRDSLYGEDQDEKRRNKP